jgi:hypothetical protein
MDNQLELLLKEMENIDIHKKIDDISLQNNHIVIVFKEDTNRYLIEELRLLFFSVCTLFKIDGKYQLVYNFKY